jgi:CheY-like chemotaxis protein
MAPTSASSALGIRAEREGEAIRFRISDTGIGISQDRIDVLFERFSQADASTTRRFGGTGLGLAICYELCSMMGGTVGVETAPGEGSVFTVTLPFAKVSDQAPTTEALPDDEGVAERDIRVLAAEDNSVNQLVLKTLLGQVGIDPVVVSDGAEALAAWEERDWDLVLMDVQMPHMDGPTATRAVRRRERETGRPRTPILALTANAMSHQVAEYLAAGMEGHIAKPIDAAKLFSAMQAALAGVEEAEEVQPDAQRA